jgi:hypothetical protein
MSGSLATGCPPIFFQQNGTLVILVQNRLAESQSLYSSRRTEDLLKNEKDGD